MKTISLLLALVAVVLAAPKAHAQSASPETDSPDLSMVLGMMRSDVNNTKIFTLNRVLKLTAPEAEQFWPIYRKYEKEFAAHGERQLALIREFAGHHAKGTLDDKASASLAKKWLENVQDRLDLWKKYHKQISKAVSPIRAAQFLQVEHQLALFLDVNIASEMPVVGTPPERKP